jgi:hypothetical protein
MLLYNFLRWNRGNFVPREELLTGTRLNDTSDGEGPFFSYIEMITAYNDSEKFGYHSPHCAQILFFNPLSGRANKLCYIA